MYSKTAVISWALANIISAACISKHAINVNISLDIFSQVMVRVFFNKLRRIGNSLLDYIFDTAQIENAAVLYYFFQRSVNADVFC